MLVSGRVDTNTHSWQSSFWKKFARNAATPGSGMLMMWSIQSNIRNHVKSIYDIPGIQKTLVLVGKDLVFGG